jgi:periplasmic copper chaperone A
MMKLTTTVAVTALVLTLPIAAQAHVTVQPEEVPAGGFTRLDVRVPSERDDAATEKVAVEMPDGFVSVSYEPVAGWRINVRSEQLDEPIEAFGEEISEQIDTVTWTAADNDAAIKPGQFRDFGLSVGMPEGAAEGETLTFPAVQTYDSGEVVRWIGPPDAEEPAAQVTLTAGEEEAESEPEEANDEADEATASAPANDDDGEAPMGLAVAALIVGATGLLTGGASLLRGRRR